MMNSLHLETHSGTSSSAKAGPVKLRAEFIRVIREPLSVPGSFSLAVTTGCDTVFSLERGVDTGELKAEMDRGHV